MTTLLVTHSACSAHDMGEGHPERPERMRAVHRALEHETFQSLLRDNAPLAAVEALTRVHLGIFFFFFGWGLRPMPNLPWVSLGHY